MLSQPSRSGSLESGKAEGLADRERRYHIVAKGLGQGIHGPPTRAMTRGDDMDVKTASAIPPWTE